MTITSLILYNEKLMIRNKVDRPKTVFHLATENKKFILVKIPYLNHNKKALCDWIVSVPKLLWK